MRIRGLNMRYMLVCAKQARGLNNTFSSAADLRVEGDENAYEVLGVSPTCSAESIRTAFRELAKVTHPDMQTGLPHPSGSARFIVVLSAYQILSNPEKRAQYDAYLQEIYKTRQKTNYCRKRSNDSCKQSVATQEMEVVEWLRWYRVTITAMVNQQEIGAGMSSQDDITGNLRAALKRAYFGSCLDEIDALPDCFEAEERADTAEVDILHLVSGRNLFGAVRQASGTELLREGIPKHMPVAGNSAIPSKNQSSASAFTTRGYTSLGRTDTTLQGYGKHVGTNHGCSNDYDQSAFVDLELYLFGNLVARATRTPVKSTNGSISQLDKMDEITIYLCSDEVLRNQIPTKRDKVQKDFPGAILGTILGLRSIDFGGKCEVYSPDGEQTHMIWHFRTPLVKHMHWFKVNDMRMQCECKSTRARLPPSKFWLFEPRCGKHNVGGWYIETLWRSASTQSRNSAGRPHGLLHPAMYIIGAAYKTLDAEAIKKQKRSLISMIWGEATLHTAAYKALEWCKKRFLL